MDEVEGPAADKGDFPGENPPVVATTPEEAMRGLYVTQMQQYAEQDYKYNQATLDKIDKRESIVSVLAPALTIFAVLIGIAGFVLMATKTLTGGLVSEAVGIVVGVASRPVWRLETRLAEDKKAIEKRLAENKHVMQITAIAAMSDGKQRSDILGDLAARLAESIGPRTKPD
jgi:hypothetical protein